MKYYIDQRQLISFVKSFSPELMRYDETDDVIYCSQGKDLILLDASDGSEINRIQTDRTIDSFELYSSF
jgi:hypothetical protein